LGYVLPWGQISYWAATVITNLLSAIPLFGSQLVIWVWGGFAVSNPTLTRFYSLHFLLPFLLLALTIIHIFYLHIYTRSNPLGINSNRIKISFHYYFIVKDFFYYILFLITLILFSCIYGYHFIDPENFIMANSLVTPTHIQPEWYFLFAYAILRAIPNKLGGVIFMLLRILILVFYTLIPKNLYFSGYNFNGFSRILFWCLIINFCLLTWLGASPAEFPYISISQILTLSYFILHIILILINFYIKK